MQNDIVRQQPKQTEEPPGQPIDDIKAPVQPGSPPASGETPGPDSANGTAESPVNTPANDFGNAPATAQNPPAGQKPEQKKQPALPRQKSTRPVGVIAAAVIVCALLVGATIYSGLNRTGGVAVPKGKSGTSAADVNSSSSLAQELDASINDTANFTDETADVTADLSDEALGL